ncbi:MAG: DUF5104 domain-containing protein [Clostridia bacterium]|nr:DUF5104 domain-containing protein [Clostridia bacterium]
MKRIISLFFTLLMLLALSSCSVIDYPLSDESRAVVTLEVIVHAVNDNEAEALAYLFSYNVLTEKSDLLDTSKDFIEFVGGKIITYSNPADNGIPSYEEFEYGKIRKEIQYSVTVETTAGKYHIAILECVTDDFDEENVGVISIYIIKAENWQNDHVYRGDGNWTPGINIEKGEIENEEISNNNFISSILADPHNLMLCAAFDRSYIERLPEIDENVTE